ncbi:MAG TPA: hypothetical protein DEA22_08270 [Blastocatellia bacterium]|nr:hypothetical protein [Blastocatellia bacterium]
MLSKTTKGANKTFPNVQILHIEITMSSEFPEKIENNRKFYKFFLILGHQAGKLPKSRNIHTESLINST